MRLRVVGSMVAAVAATCTLALAGCGGGGSGSIPAPAGAPLPAPTLAPGADRIAYATFAVSRTGPVTITAYDRSGAVVYSAQDAGGARIAFDASGRLWLDRIGEYATYLPDGTLDATPQVASGGALAGFDPRGAMYTQGATSVSVLRPASDGTFALVDTLTTPPEPCYTAADAMGRVYVATCVAAPAPAYRTMGPVTMYSLVTNAALATNAAASGPITVDGAGNLYAVYGGAVGVWSPGSLAGPPARTLTVGAAQSIISVAVDRGGTVYVVAGRAAPPPGGTTTLYALPPGSSTPVILQTGVVQVATPPQ